MEIRLLMTGRGYHEADQLPATVELAADATATDAVGMLKERYPKLVVDSMLVLVDGKHAGTVAECASLPLQPNSELELVAPVAGG